jgi:hypothetical protein
MYGMDAADLCSDDSDALAAERILSDARAVMENRADPELLLISQAITNTDLLEKANRRLGFLQALRDVDRAIIANPDLEMTLDVFLHQTVIQLGVDAADILLMDSHSHLLEYKAGIGFEFPIPEQTHRRFGRVHEVSTRLDSAVPVVPKVRVSEGVPDSSFLPGEGFVFYYAVPLLSKGQILGIMEVFHKNPLTPDPEWMDFLEALAGQAAIAIDNAMLFAAQQQANEELSRAYETTLEGWSRALDLRDKETEGHSFRVTEMTVQLAAMMGVVSAELSHIRRGALLHDIGKMGIPDSILMTHESLTEDEWEVMRRHPVYANELLSPIAFLRPALDIPYCHHERWDGTGYPRGLKGEQIPLAARIFAVVDVWDALRSDRPYRKAWSRHKVLDHIVEKSGTHFDPMVVSTFVGLIREGIIVLPDDEDDSMARAA